MRETWPEFLIEGLRRLIHIGLGRDHPQLAELQAHPLEELSDLGQAPADAGDPLDRGGGLAGGAGRVLAEVVLQGSAVLVPFALGPGPVDPLEPLDATLLELPQGGPQGVLGDPKRGGRSRGGVALGS